MPFKNADDPDDQCIPEIVKIILAKTRSDECSGNGKNTSPKIRPQKEWELLANNLLQEEVSNRRMYCLWKAGRERMPSLHAAQGCEHTFDGSINHPEGSQNFQPFPNRAQCSGPEAELTVRVGSPIFSCEHFLTRFYQVAAGNRMNKIAKGYYFFSHR